MVFKEVIYGVALFLGFASLNFAVAGSVNEWEGALGDDREVAQGLIEEVVVEEDTTPDFVEIVVHPKAELPRLAEKHVKLPRKDFSFVPLPLSGGRGTIIDETATTGENANKHLPPSVKKEQKNPSDLYEINQVIPPLLPSELSFGHEK